MEAVKIEQLLEKYEAGSTTIVEENDLNAYFSSANVAPHLKSYAIIFSYYKHSKQEKSTLQLPLKTKKQTTKWVGIAAALLLFFGIGTAVVLHQKSQTIVTDLGTFNNPETALKETQKALDVLATHLNTGIESVAYVGEFQKSKERVFN